VVTGARGCSWAAAALGLALAEVVRPAGAFGTGLPDLNGGCLSDFSFKHKHVDDHRNDDSWAAFFYHDGIIF